jgi:preprotein translocase subunit YajC
MKRGDSVLTTGGILGRIEGLTDQFVILEIADGVRVRVLKTQVASGIPDEVVKK